MEITVNGQVEQFQLATKHGWKEFAGHRITIGEFQFAAIPYFAWLYGESLNISEVTSGAKMVSLDIDLDKTDTQERTIEYLEKVIAPVLAKIIKKQGVEKFKEEIKKKRKESVDLLGEQPPIIDIDVEEKVIEMGDNK